MPQILFRHEITIPLSDLIIFGQQVKKLPYLEKNYDLIKPNFPRNQAKVLRQKDTVFLRRECRNSI